MNKIKKYENIVYEILSDFPITRSDDFLLYYLVVREHFNINPHLGDIEKRTFYEIMHAHIFMDTIAAVRNRILQLCGEREISINKLATISALPPSSIKNSSHFKSCTSISSF